MFEVALIVILLVAAGVAFWVSKGYVDEPGYVPKWAIQTAGGVFIVLSGLFFLGLSVVYVDKDEIATLEGIYLPNDMETGQIVALAGQNGPQVRTLPPGIHIESFIKFFYDIDYASITTVDPNTYGIVTAKDGSALSNGQVIAAAWENHEDMINAEKFLSKVPTGKQDAKGNDIMMYRGQKGMQLTVLKPGVYRINPYLFEVSTGHSALQVKTGEVAVIRSNVTDSTIKDCTIATVDEGLTTALVPKGCKGVWDEPLYQGMFFLNINAYKPTLISTRVQVWAYKGGYTTKKINLTVMDDGSITQQVENIDMPIPKNAADKAINVRTEGWTVPVEARVTVQVTPENAPRVVAGVGSLQNVEDKITTPEIRNSLRTIGGRAPSGCNKKGTSCKDEGGKVLDFVSKRDEIAEKVLKDIKLSTEQAGVTILEVNLGEPAIPPELLLANQRQQLAEQLKKTYIAERDTQKERIKSQREKATADQQKDLVKAEILEKAAKHLKNKRKLEGEGERLYLTEKGRGEEAYLTSTAKGKEAQVKVLGKEKVFELEVLKIVADSPAMVKVPYINVGDGAGLEGAAAVFGGASNLSKFMQQSAVTK